MAVLRFWPLALALLAFMAGWTVQGWRWEAKEKAALEATIEAQNLQSKRFEADLAAERAKYRNLSKRLANETSKPDYRCPVPASGVQLYNDAISNASEPHR